MDRSRGSYGIDSGLCHECVGLKLHLIPGEAQAILECTGKRKYSGSLLNWNKDRER